MTTEFKYDSSFSIEGECNPLIRKKMPYLEFTDGKGHDCYYGKQAVEIKYEAGYLYTGEKVTQPRFKAHMEKEYYKKGLRETTNIFIEIFSHMKYNTLGGVAQSYFKNPAEDFVIAHVFPYNDIMFIMNGKRLVKYLLENNNIANKELK